ncbi:MAG: SRPBCC family protein [Bacteroidia bacterium]|nr:SRPBCC family protein [Bacteroidia bacterium]
MIDLKFDTKINKPIEEVWRFIIDEFPNAHHWATGTPTCRKGTESEDFDRVCDTETGRLMDTITKIDHENHVLEFSVKGLPFFVRSVVSSWKLSKLSNTQTEITLGPRIEVMPVIGTLMQIPMKIAFKKLYPGLLNDLTTFIETGKPSPRKQKEIDSSN